MITPEPPAGSEHYREGWRHGYEQAAIDRERSADAARLVPATLNSELKVGAFPDTAGRCGDIGDLLFNKRYCCELRAGHAGWHREGVTEWSGVVAHRAASEVPDTGQAREPDAHPVGGFTHDRGLVALVAGQIAETYSDDEYQIRPDPGDVIAAVMETVRADIRDRAEDQARCGKTDECAAKALVLTRLADWLEGWPSGDTVQAPDVTGPLVAVRVGSPGSGYLVGPFTPAEAVSWRIANVTVPGTQWAIVPLLPDAARPTAEALLGTDTTPDRLAWISEAGETAAVERQARYQETACARRPAEERPDA